MVTDPPRTGAALTARLLTAPTLAVELARRGVTVEVGVLAEAEFWSAYQPIVSLADRSVVAHEALLRGVVDGREVGGGDLFFVAEQAGWLRPPRPHRPRVGHRRRRRPGSATTTCSSTSTRRRSTGRRSAWPAPSGSCTTPASRPSQLVFEVVESHAIADRGHLVSILDHYRSLGWRVALDDVGAGWSSLSLLAAVRPEVVKLDKALVQELPDDGARTVLKAVTDLAHQLGAVVVAEGVETERLAEEVTALGADLGQGWLFGRPVRPERPVEEPEGRWQPVTRPTGPPRRAGGTAGQCSAHAGEHRAGVLVPEHAVAAGRQREQCAGLRGEPQPAGGEHPQHVPVGDQRDVPVGEPLAGAVEHPVHAGADLGQRLARCRRPGTVPSRQTDHSRPSSCTDLRRRPALVAAVVDLDQVVVDGRGASGRPARRCGGPAAAG